MWGNMVSGDTYLAIQPNVGFGSGNHCCEGVWIDCVEITVYRPIIQVRILHGGGR